MKFKKIRWDRINGINKVKLSVLKSNEVKKCNKIKNKKK